MGAISNIYQMSVNQSLIPSGRKCQIEKPICRLFGFVAYLWLRIWTLNIDIYEYVCRDSENVFGCPALLFCIREVCRSHFDIRGQPQVYIYIYIFFFNSNWVDTQWQQYSTHLHTNSTQNTENGTYITIKRKTKIGKCGPCPRFASYTLTCTLQLRKKHGKPSGRVV
jgi:hypothetical protein